MATQRDWLVITIALLGIGGLLAFWGTIFYVAHHFITKFW